LTHDRLEQLEMGARDLLVTLPNGGLAFYYPKTFKVQRMIGNLYRYSAYAQGSMVETYLRLHQKYPGKDYLKMAEKAYLSMRFPYEKGGVGLSDRAFLEFPNYNSIPEIILNGWLDALVHVRNYAEYSKDEEALALVQSQIEFLSVVLPYYDAPSLRLSRYSDVSPYLFSVYSDNLEPEGINQEPLRIVLLHQPKVKGLKPYAYFLSSEGFRPEALKTKSIYENYIVSTKPKRSTFRASLSRLYDNVILVNAPKSNLGYYPGSYDPMASSPVQKPTSEQIVVRGKPVGKRIREAYTMFDLDKTSMDETLGYPTNFLKPGNQNFYHMYHIITLFATAATIDDFELKQNLARWGLKWHEYTLNSPYEANGHYANANEVWNLVKKYHSKPLKKMTYEDLVEGARNILESSSANVTITAR
jgi:hypothetical protein